MSDAAPRRAYYVTTPIYYVNDKPHIGHAYTTLACDVLARFKRLDGFDVRFQTGTDEHGQKVEKSAKAAGSDPRSFTDAGSQKFCDLLAFMNFTADDFIRTTEARHINSAQAIWRAIAKAGDIYLGHYEGWYAVRDEAFYAEDEVKPGPNGKMVGPSGAEVEWVKEPSYFFRLSAWQDRLLAFYASHPDFILPESRRNEVVSFVKAGLRDLSVSRTSFTWGIPVPDAPGHVMYVWLDALTNYITAAGYPDTNSASFRTYWPADLHMIGKDILRFHAVYWPAFLMAAGIAPPRRVFAHGWILNKGEKMSKSLGNVLSPHELVNEFGLDAVRYCLLREVPFGQDGYIGRETIIARINGDLANDLGNLAQRVLSFIAKNGGAQVPQPGPLSSADQALIGAAEKLLDTVRLELDRQAFHRALEAVWLVIGDANRYIDKQAPWTLRKTDPARMATVLYVTIETLRRIAILLQPFMPSSAARILDQLAVSARDFAVLAPGQGLVAGTPLPPPAGVFPRFVEAADAGR
ncbi:MAG: methionine--tRNA ligase [Alphaproteobacteria bacterium]|nr:methionine--tRNA ligase [Alphaproteobacteria bacterium]